jgi:hypothetical protein
MRALKIIAALILLGVVGLYAYVEIIIPATWHSRVRKDSIERLQAAQQSGNLTNAVGSLGIVIQLTNNAWIAIRYLDTHGAGIRSMAVACDSGGGWFESRRHFCGSFGALQAHKQRLEVEEELRKIDPDHFTPTLSTQESEDGLTPSIREMVAIESAPDLAGARAALMKIGFTEFHP